MNPIANLIKFNSNEFPKTILHKKNTYAKPMHIYPFYFSFATWKGNICGGPLLEIIYMTTNTSYEFSNNLIIMLMSIMIVDFILGLNW